MRLDLEILIDTREVLALSFPGYETHRVTLRTGDYSVIANGQNLSSVVAIERKSLTDLLGCVGGERERFERELRRLQDFRFRALVIEANLTQLVGPHRFSTLSPKQVVSSVLAWTFKYQVAPLFCDNRDYAAATVRTLLTHAARYALAEEAAG